MGRFPKGNPGGPGRPKGSRNKAYAEFDAIAQQGLAKAVRAITEAAGDGETQAARMMFARVWPRARGRVVELDLPPLQKPADLITAYATLVEAIGNGEVSPDEAAKVSEVLERKRLAIETASHEPRITELEHKRGLKPVA